MATAESVFQRGDRRGRRTLRTLADEFRDQRRSLGLSQEAVARASHISRPRYTRVEAGRVDTLTVLEAARIGSVLGLDVAARAYPGGSPLRDAAHARRLHMVAVLAAPPLRFRTEVGLPPRADTPEQRAWDAELRGAGERTVIELEMRLTDAQAQERRLAAKRRDDPADRFLLLVADSAHNRRVLRDHPALFPDLPRLRWAEVATALARGRHPPTGLARARC